jgi:GNAT superfamily N-acetyltransferase
VTVEPSQAASALAESWRLLIEDIPGGWARSTTGATVAVTGVASPTLNGVVVDGEDVDVGTVAGLLDEVAATGLPYSLQYRPAMEDSLAEVASARGMTREEPDVPLMVWDRRGEAVLADPPAGLLIRELTPAEAPLHADVAAAGFEAPVEHFRQLVSPVVLDQPGVRCYLGEIDGVPVTTGLGVQVGSSIAVFNIGTPAAYRRKGYGAAVTARVVEDGLSSGSNWAWLQSSEAGLRVYERLGFRTTEWWPSWITREGSGS